MEMVFLNNFTIIGIRFRNKVTKKEATPCSDDVSDYHNKHNERLFSGRTGFKGLGFRLGV